MAQNTCWPARRQSRDQLASQTTIMHKYKVESVVRYKTYRACNDMRGMLPFREGLRVHPNNFVYKGYRLTAKVTRGIQNSKANTSGSPVFTASVFVVQADAVQETGDEYMVPGFAEGNVVYSPREAVHEAISHGCAIVDALTGVTG